MHELSIALSILEFAEEEADRRDATIEAVHIKLGALSGIVKKALLSATTWLAKIRRSAIAAW